MRMIDIIHKKREGLSLTTAEIHAMIAGYIKGEIPDYQMSAMMMAIYFKGMNAKETADLTMAIVESGEQIDLSAIEGIKVDKHSTGGVGDTTTLILAPLVASCGVPVAKMSGRGLGHTGGTLDKLESVQGFQVEIEKRQFIELVNKNKVAVIGQSGSLTPADKQLYALRDVTATVESIPLIASSIMSKKIAAGADAIVLDVKTGSGAFMQKEADAMALAQAMVNIGQQVGRQTTAIISHMEQPLGNAVGNALEIIEAIETLQGRGPKDLEELCLSLGSHMLLLANKVASKQAARDLLQEQLHNGKAYETMLTMVESQHGDSSQLKHPERLPTANKQVEVFAQKEGFVQGIHARKIGELAMKLGAGRMTKDSVIDLAVGVQLHKKIGDKVLTDEPLATLHMNESLPEASSLLIEAYQISAEKPPSHPLIISEISEAN